MSMDYDRRGRVTLIETLLRFVPGALFTIRNMLGIDPDGGGVPDATTTVRGKVELATVDEAVEGIDNERAVTSEGVAAATAAAIGALNLKPQLPLIFSSVADITDITGYWNAIITPLTITIPSHACYTTIYFSIGGFNATYALSKLGTAGAVASAVPYINGSGITSTSAVAAPAASLAGASLTVWSVSHLSAIS